MNTNTRKQTAFRIIELADANITCTASMVSSAMVSLEDARACFARGDFRFAAERAMKSLAYSVGIMHEAHRAAEAMVLTDDDLERYGETRAIGRNLCQA